jgi:hypothetical protein
VPHPLRPAALLALAAFACIQPMHNEARADARSVTGSILKTLGAGMVNSALNSSNGTRDVDYFAPGDTYIDPDRYSAPSVGSGGGTYPSNGRYSPVSDVFCYPDDATCYNSNGSLAKHWTDTLYGK